MKPCLTIRLWHMRPVARASTPPRTLNTARKGARSRASLREVLGLVYKLLSAPKCSKQKLVQRPTKNRLGVVPKPSEDLPSGPVELKSRHHGQKGHVYITTKATIPYVAFWTNSTIEKIDTVEWEDLHPIWSIPIGDITELKKVGGYGWKAKLVVGWALGSEVVDGLEIFYRRGNSWKVTAMTLRDGPFNHLIAMGGQKWGSW